MSQKKSKTSILIVDDEPQIRKMLEISLESEDYKVEEAINGQEALELVAARKPDAMILDLGLPDIDGLEVITRVRAFSNVPIIVLSVRSDEQDKVAALDNGANDYVNKPFNMSELLARVRANIRDTLQQEGTDAITQIGDIEVDFLKRIVKKKQQMVDLSPKEYDLLTYFVKNAGMALTHRQILKEVWGSAHVDDNQYLRVYTGQVRQKIEDDPSSPQYILTEAGIGYRMVDPKTGF